MRERIDFKSNRSAAPDELGALPRPAEPGGGELTVGAASDTGGGLPFPRPPGNSVVADSPSTGAPFFVGGALLLAPGEGADGGVAPLPPGCGVAFVVGVSTLPRMIGRPSLPLP